MLTIVLSTHSGLVYAEHYVDGIHTETIKTQWTAKQVKSQAGKCRAENALLEIYPLAMIVGSYNAPTIF